MRPAYGSASVLKTKATSSPSSARLERDVARPRPAPVHRRRREVLDERVEQAVGRQVLGRHAAGDREQVPLGDALLERGDDLLVRDLLALEVALHQLVGVLGDLVHELLAVLLGLRRQVVGDLDLLAVVAVRRRRTRRPSCRSGRSRRAPRARCRSGSRSRPRAGRRRSLSESSVRKKSARSRSSMFTKTSRARPSSSARSQSRSVWTSTPITALTTNTAPSHDAQRRRACRRRSWARRACRSG